MEFPNYSQIVENLKSNLILTNYLNEGDKHILVELAGIVFLYQGNILLCYPKNKSLEQQWSIPKGRVDKGEKRIEAAIRETYEEIGIKVKKSQLGDENKIVFAAKKNEVKVLSYWIYRVENLADIGLKDLIIPSALLKKGEMKEAKFFPFEEAEVFMKQSYTDILRKIKNI